jgi:hypothetical protein
MCSSPFFLSGYVAKSKIKYQKAKLRTARWAELNFDRLYAIIPRSNGIMLLFLYFLGGSRRRDSTFSGTQKIGASIYGGGIAVLCRKI